MNFKNKLMVTILHKKKKINLKSKEKIILLQTQAYFWIKKTTTKLNTNLLTNKLLYIKLYGKKK